MYALLSRCRHVQSAVFPRAKRDLAKPAPPNAGDVAQVGLACIIDVVRSLPYDVWLLSGFVSNPHECCHHCCTQADHVVCLVLYSRSQSTHGGIGSPAGTISTLRRAPAHRVPSATREQVRLYKIVDHLA